MRLSTRMRIPSRAIVLAIAAGGLPLQNGQAAEPQTTPAVDQYDHALPSGVVARLSAVRFPHPCPLYSWAYSPDGKTLVSLAEDQVVRFWNTANGQLTHKIDSPATVITPWPGQVAVSPDGRRAAIAYGSVWIRILDLTNAEILHDIKALRPDVVRDGWHAVEFFAAPPLLLVGSERASFWIDPESGKVQSRVHTGRFVARSKSADVCAFSDENYALELVRLQAADGPRFQPASLYTIRADRAIALSPDGRQIAVTGIGRIRKQGVVATEYPSASIEIHEISTNKLSSLMEFLGYWSTT
ncbi:MAG TPA: hypothetical protein VMV10_26645 [Pirellulales bacterium]|nr:hypothetical protein [Pirellulales bacterium]